MGLTIPVWKANDFRLPDSPRARAMLFGLIIFAGGALWLIVWGGLLRPLMAPLFPALVVFGVMVVGMMVVPAALGFVLTQLHLTQEETLSGELNESLDRFRGFFDGAQDAFFVCDPAGRFQLINRAGCELLGVDPVAERLSLFSVVAPEDTVQVSEIAGSPPPGHDHKTFEVEMLTAEGTRIPVEITTEVLRDAGGSVVNIHGQARLLADSSANGSAPQGPSQLQILIEHLPEAIVLLGHDGRVLATNPPAQALLSEYGTYLAEDRLVLFGGIPVEQLLERAAAMHRQEIVVREPYHQILEVIGQAFSDEDSITGAALVIRDVTSQRQRRERLERNDRLAAVGQLAAGIAHDFKNILQGINLCAELSRSQEPSAAGHDDNMLTIIEQSTRGSKLIQQIMDFTRQSESTQRLLDLADLVTDTSELLSPGIPEDILLSVEIADGEYSVMADPGQIQQALTNLVLNGCDAMPDGGRITLSLSQLGDPEDRGPVPIEVREGDWLRLAVADTGTGIPRSVQHRVFEPFFTTKRAGSGTGLGLAQVYGNVHQHGGHVEFETTDGMGTTFSVFLPAYRHHLENGSPGDSERKCPRGNGETVLVVEDELAVLNATAQSLRALGYVALEAVDGNDALELFNRAERVDLVLTDARMPGMDGLALIRRIKRLDPEVRVLLMTAHAPEAGAGPEAPTGADGLLRKPFTLESLGQAVYQTLATLTPSHELGGST
jgi:PAS domain S-box-containing protein